MLAVQEVRDDVANRVETYVTTNLARLWDLVERVPAVHRRVNGDPDRPGDPQDPDAARTRSARWRDYTSWASLTDRTYDSRHLPPRRRQRRPAAGRDVAALFNRGGEMTPCEKSTVLFPYFAEWFVDGFLRSERPHPDPDTGEPMRDHARNESNHEIDLIQLYGLNADVTRAAARVEGGRLQSQQLDGEEYPPYLYDGATKRFDHVTVVAPSRSPTTSAGSCSRSAATPATCSSAS